ncbi:MAG: hypothetical protein IJH53_04600 [Oscillospiraceae bacterium]|nr:hypothetical protein [Oscillospiraceae bacterium]
MRNCLEIGSELILKEKNTENSYSVRIIDFLGAGASCIAYLAEDLSNEGLRYILKECFPIKDASRESGAEVIWSDDEAKTANLSRFTRAYNMQKKLQNDSETSNDLAHITHGLLEANNTLYMIIDPRCAVAYDDPATAEISLQDIFRTAKALSEAIGAQHRAGYLNLDIKPSNIMVIPNRRDSVLLLDFDSLVDKRSVLSAPSSYSPAYAAPEQLQHKLKKISEATDIYAIGAVVFSRIFGRTPESDDRSIFSDWNLEDHPLFAKLSSKVKRLTKELFYKTLGASPKSRFQNASELSALLDELVVESDLTRRYLVSTCPDPVNIFVGREKELCKIHDAFASGNKLVFLTGMGGIGKTELAKNYAKQYGSAYDVICFGEYSGSVEEMFKDDEFIDVENDSENTLSLKSVKALLDDRVLIIIDNYSSKDGISDPGFDKLRSCSCKVLVTSREASSDLFETAEEIDLAELSKAEQFRLFEKEYGAEITEEHRPVIESILSKISGFTLLIPLIAKLLNRSRSLSPEDVLDRITSAGVTDLSDIKVRHKKDSATFSASINTILKSVLDMSGLSDDERFVLDCFSMLKGIVVTGTTIIRWIGEKYEDSLNKLIDNHWLQCSGKGEEARLSIHNVIRDVLGSDAAHKPDTSWIKTPVDEYIEAIDKYTLRNEVDPEHGYSLERKHGNNPDLTYPDDPICTIYGSAQIRFSKMGKLVDNLLNYFDPDKEAAVIIDFFADITDFDNYYVYNFTIGGKGLLKAIESSPAYVSLSSDDKICLYILLALFSLRDLYSVEKTTHRSDAYVNSLTDDIVSYAVMAETLIYNTYHSDKDTLYGMYNRLFYELLSAGRSWGINMFLTAFPEYSEEAAEKYGQYVNSFAENVISSFPEKFEDEEKLECSIYGGGLEMFNNCLKPGSFERAWDNFYKRMEYDAAWWQDEYRKKLEAKDLSSMDKDEMFDWYSMIADDYRSEASRIASEVIQLGYKGSLNPEKEERISLENLTDLETIKKAENLLQESDAKYQLASEANKKAYGDRYDSIGIDLVGCNEAWLAASCIFSCCRKEFDKALDYYGLLLSECHHFWGRPADLAIYQTISYLGFDSVAKEVLKLNINYLKNRLNPKNDDYERSEESRWRICTALIENYELLGDEKQADKYKSLLAKMTDTGFIIE